MKVYRDIEQGSDEWLNVRLGIPTASEMGVLVTAGGKIAEGKGVHTYLCEKLAEKWLGRPLDLFTGTKATDAGKVLEDDALPKFELETGLDLERVGFVTTDDGRCGCSPDSLIVGSNVGVEAKAPQPHTHVKYLIGGVLPDEYFAQVQASMMICAAPHWWFISYCRGFPELILEVKRDEKYIATLTKAVALFNERLDEAYAKLLKLNGGREPERRKIVTQTDGDVTTATLEGVDVDALDILVNSPEMNG